MSDSPETTDEETIETAEEDADALESTTDTTTSSVKTKISSSIHRHPIAMAIAAAIIGLLLGLWFAGGGTDSSPSGDAEVEGEQEHDEATTYTCSMHPQIRSDEPGQCPICGMDLIPVSEDGDDAATANSPARVQLTERSKTLARVRTAEVRRPAGGTQEVRLLGKVDHDETRVRTVTSWTAGRIDRLHVATTGEKVRNGQTIATIYSPEIYTAHRDLLQAKRQLEALSDGMAFARDSAIATVESARQKLKLLGVSSREIEQMEASDEPWTQIRIRARATGTVIDRLVDEGNYIQAGTGIYRVAHLDKLWVQLDAYESDLSRLRVGQDVGITVDAIPGERFDGTIAFIDPIVNRAKRTARVRVEVDNEDEKLRPGMFVEAIVEGGAVTESPPLVIPATAPLFAGRRSVVYVEVPQTDRPVYEAREVKLGPKSGDVYPVLSGVEHGERVVVHGAFAIDADLQIKGGHSLMTRPDDETRGPEQIIEVDAAFRDRLEPVVEHYLNLQSALAGDDLEGARVASEGLAKAAKEFDAGANAAAAEAWVGIDADLQQHAQHTGHAKDLAAAREAFDGLSGAVSKLLSRFGNPTDRALHVAHCPMAFDNRGADWVQATDEVDNSYFGEAMLTCGEIRRAIPPGGYLETDQQQAPTSAPAGGHDH